MYSKSRKLLYMYIFLKMMFYYILRRKGIHFVFLQNVRIFDINSIHISFIDKFVGFVGGSFYNHHGGSSKELCLPDNPEYDYYQSGRQNHGFIYGTEYETNDFSIFKKLHDNEAPCVVCKIPRTAVIMIPGNVFMLLLKDKLVNSLFYHQI